VISTLTGGGREVEVGAHPAQDGVAHGAAHEGQLETGRLEAAAEVVDLRGQRLEHGGGPGAGVLEAAGGLGGGFGHGCPVLRSM